MKGKIMATWKNLIAKVAGALKIKKPGVTQVKKTVTEYYYSDKRIRDIFTPVTETVTGAVKKGYDVSRQFDGAVRTQVRVIHEYLSDDQIRELVSRNLISGIAMVFFLLLGAVQSLILSRPHCRIKMLHLRRKDSKELEKALRSRKVRVEVDIYIARTRTNSNDKLDLRKHINPNPDDILRLLLMMKHLDLKIIDGFVMAKPRSKTDLKPH